MGFSGLTNQFSRKKQCHILVCYSRRPVFVGPSHHGVARPQVAEEGTASDIEGSCE